jgi:hypothetical protein
MDRDDWWARFARQDRLDLLAFEEELAKLPRPLIAALWEEIDRVSCLTVPVARDRRSARAGSWSRPAHQPLTGSRLVCLAHDSGRPRGQTGQLT